MRIEQFSLSALIIPTSICSAAKNWTAEKWKIAHSVPLLLSQIQKRKNSSHPVSQNPSFCSVYNQ